MVKKITLEDIETQVAAGFAKQGKEIHDLTASVEHIVKHMATKDDIAEVKEDVAEVKEQVIAVHTQVNSIERQLRETRTEVRLGNLEEKVFGSVRA